jgi:hypothetical protein
MEAKARQHGPSVPAPFSALRKAGGLRRRLAALVSSNATERNGTPNPHQAIDEVGARLAEYMRGSGTIILHGLRLPDRGDEISHLLIGPAGITVVDSSNYTSGRATVGRAGLRVGRRDRSDLIRAVLEQAEEISRLLAGTPYSRVPIEVALAWRRVEGLPILHSLNAPRIMVCSLRTIAREASRPGPLSARRVKALAAFFEIELGEWT